MENILNTNILLEKMWMLFNTQREKQSNQFGLAIEKLNKWVNVWFLLGSMFLFIQDKEGNNKTKKLFHPSLPWWTND